MELMRRQEIYLKLVQDGAPGHVVGETKEDPEECKIIVIF
jgi:hypothetical protein